MEGVHIWHNNRLLCVDNSKFRTALIQRSKSKYLKSVYMAYNAYIFRGCKMVHILDTDCLWFVDNNKGPCADPESFTRWGPSLTTLMGWREDRNATKSGPSSARERTA